MSTDTRECQICGLEITGRSDKMFCSDNCRNKHHNNLKSGNIIGKVKLHGMLIALNALSVDQHMLDTVNKVPYLPGRFVHNLSEGKVSFQYKKKS